MLEYVNYVLVNFGVVGVTAGIAVAALALAYFVPSTKVRLIAVAVAALSIFGARQYRRGWFASEAERKRRTEKMVQKKQEDYREIDRRNDSVRSLVDRLRGRGRV